MARLYRLRPQDLDTLTVAEVQVFLDDMRAIAKAEREQQMQANAAATRRR